MDTGIEFAGTKSLREYGGRNPVGLPVSNGSVDPGGMVECVGDPPGGRKRAKKDQPSPPVWETSDEFKSS